MFSLLKDTKITQCYVGTTQGLEGLTANGTAVSMDGFDRATFVMSVAKCAANTSGVNMYIAACCSSGGTFHTIAGSAATAGSSQTNMYTAIEIDDINHEWRWLKPTIVTLATCDWVGGILCFQYPAQKAPVTQATCHTLTILHGVTSGTP